MTAKPSLPTVLLFFSEQELRDEVATVLARAGIITEAMPSQAACVARLQASNGVGMVLAQADGIGSAEAFAAHLQRNFAGVVAFMSGDEAFTGPAESPVYCEEAFESDPQAFAESVAFRLSAMSAIETKAMVTTLVASLTALIPPAEGPNDMLVRESRILGRRFVPAAVSDWWANRDAILKLAIGALIALIAAAATSAGSSIVAQLDHAADVPRLAAEQADSIRRQARTEAEVDILRRWRTSRGVTPTTTGPVR